MHTATRLALQLFDRIRGLASGAHICFYGLYAPTNEPYLREMGAHTILGGEFEEDLVDLSRRLARIKAAPSNGESNASSSQHIVPGISLHRQKFIPPDRHDLPPLSRYARLCHQQAPSKVVGYVEATRGCKHFCRHCPIVPVYNGQFRIVQQEVVLTDIRQQVEAGAEHITFGDPDFFNGPGHVLPIVRALHREFPRLTYDVTIKIEHLLKYARHLPLLQQTGCAIVTSAVESIDDRILNFFDKRHSRGDFVRVVKLFDELGLTLNPTFVSFTPWTTLAGYCELLEMLAQFYLVDNISPVQLAIRLLIPQGSKLLELTETQAVIAPFDKALLCYPWRTPDPRVDELQQRVEEIVNSGHKQQASRKEIFRKIWDCANSFLGISDPVPQMQAYSSRTAVPYLNEPWYC